MEVDFFCHGKLCWKQFWRLYVEKHTGNSRNTHCQKKVRKSQNSMEQK